MCAATRAPAVHAASPYSRPLGGSPQGNHFCRPGCCTCEAIVMNYGSGAGSAVIHAFRSFSPGSVRSLYEVGYSFPDSFPVPVRALSRMAGIRKVEARLPMVGFGRSETVNFGPNPGIDPQPDWTRIRGAQTDPKRSFKLACRQGRQRG
jgi:hypothetical protein